MAAARVQSMEKDTQSIIYHKASTVFKGTAVTEHPELNLSEIFLAISDHVGKLADKSAKSLEEYSAAAVNVSKKAGRLANLATASILLAFILLLVFAIENASLVR